MDIQVQVLGVFAGQTTTGKSKWDVQLSDGSKATAWEVAVATKAQQAQQQGAVVTARVVEKPNPRGGNPYRNLTAIFLQGESVPADLTPQVAQFPQQAVAAPQGGNGGFTGGYSGMSPEREVKIVKQSMLAAAANLVGHVYSGSADLEAAEEHVARIAKGWFAEVFNTGKPAAPAAAAPPVPDVHPNIENPTYGVPGVQVGTQGVVVQAAPVAALPWTAA